MGAAALLRSNFDLRRWRNRGSVRRHQGDRHTNYAAQESRKIYVKKNLLTAIRMTIATTILLGIIYPLAVTGLAQTFFRDKANGQLIEANGKIVGSRIIGQAFTGSGYFHSRPSAVNYDASNSNGSQLGQPIKADRPCEWRCGEASHREPGYAGSD